MATSSQIAIRRVVPRWRSFEEALRLKELEPVQLASDRALGGEEFLREKEEAWKLNGELLFATDLVSAACVFGRTETAKQAAEFVLAQPSNSSSLARQLSAKVLGIESETAGGHPPVWEPGEKIYEVIRSLKLRRVSEPRNAFVWSDLARLYVMLGMVDQAAEPMRIALALAPFDRFIIRNATRYYLHVGHTDAALSLLRKTGRTPLDPWLMAAELAVAAVAGKQPRFYKTAREWTKRGSLPAFHASEMLVALGSLEMWDGNDRQARRLFTEALTEPTENALAQIIWASREVGLSTSLEETRKFKGAFEANTLAARNESRWRAVVDNAKLWAKEEWFSSRPHALGSAIATSILQDGKEGENISRGGLLSNVGHPGLVNNLAFALVEQGRAAEAKDEIAKADFSKMDISSRICLVATRGLIEYRLGNQIVGNALYREAVNYAEKHSERDLKATAQLYWAREEAFAGRDSYWETLEAGTKELTKAKSPQNVALAQVVIQDILKKELSDVTGTQPSAPAQKRIASLKAIAATLCSDEKLKPVRF